MPSFALDLSSWPRILRRFLTTVHLWWTGPFFMGHRAVIRVVLTGWCCDRINCVDHHPSLWSPVKLNVFHRLSFPQSADSTQDAATSQESDNNRMIGLNSAAASAVFLVNLPPLGFLFLPVCGIISNLIQGRKGCGWREVIKCFSHTIAFWVTMWSWFTPSIFSNFFDSHFRL